MRFLHALGFTLIALSPLTGTAEAQTHISKPPISTYKTVTVGAYQNCSDLCQADTQCRGVVSYQADTNIDIIQCYLNDGLSPGSPFEIKAPEPLDLAIALENYNQYRAKHDLAPVKLNGRLIAASQTHAEDLAEHGIASHEGTDGTHHGDRVQQKGYYFSIAAENVATGQNSWDKVFKAWQQSPGHNENLLLPDVSDFGVALVFNPETTYAYYWAMIVAAPFDDQDN